MFVDWAGTGGHAPPSLPRDAQCLISGGQFGAGNYFFLPPPPGIDESSRTLNRRLWSQTALRYFGILVQVKILYETRLRDNSVGCDAELVTY